MYFSSTVQLTTLSSSRAGSRIAYFFFNTKILGGGHYNESDPSTGGGGSGFLNYTMLDVFDGMNIRFLESSNK